MVRQDRVVFIILGSSFLLVTLSNIECFILLVTEVCISRLERNSCTKYATYPSICIFACGHCAAIWIYQKNLNAPITICLVIFLIIEFPISQRISFWLTQKLFKWNIRVLISVYKYITYEKFWKAWNEQIVSTSGQPS